MTCSKLRGNISITDENYLIGKRNEGVKHYVDRHELALLEKDEFSQILINAGFETIFQKDGLLKDRGIFINVKKQ